MAGIEIAEEEIRLFCRRHHIRKLSLFGSVLRDDFGPDSDVDVLVEYEPGQAPGFIELFSLEEELGRILGGRRADIVNARFLNRRLRRPILESAEVQYAEG